MKYTVIKPHLVGGSLRPAHIRPGGIRAGHKLDAEAFSSPRHLERLVKLGVVEPMGTPQQTGNSGVQPSGAQAPKAEEPKRPKAATPKAATPKAATPKAAKAPKGAKAKPRAAAKKPE